MIYCTADNHLHAWDEFSKVLPDGTNSRLQDGVNVLMQVIEAAKGETFVMVGDLFQAREEITHDVLTAAADCINYASDTCRQVFLLVGNHDQHLKRGDIHSLQPFKKVPKVTVIDHPVSMEVDGMWSAFMPYIHDYQEWLEEWKKLQDNTPHPHKLAFVHADIIGAQMDGGFMSDKGVSVSLFKDLEWCIAGHYHKPQIIGSNTHYCGSPYHITRNDAGDEKRYLKIDHHDSKHSTVHSIELTGYPKFRKVKFSDRKSEKTDDFVDVVCTTEELKEAWKHDLTGLNPVLESVTNRGAESFSASKPSLAVKEWLEKRGRSDLLEMAIARMGT